MSNKRVNALRIVTGALVSVALVHCAHKPISMKKEKIQSVAQVPVDNKVEIPSMGMTFVIKEKTEGTPVAAIFDKSGEFYPEIQNKINKKMLAVTQVGLEVVSHEVQPEHRIYRDSKERYATLVIEAKTINGLTKRPQVIKFLVPVERMVIDQKGEKANGLGFWNTTDIRVLDSSQKLPL